MVWHGVAVPLSAACAFQFTFMLGPSDYRVPQFVTQKLCDDGAHAEASPRCLCLQMVTSKVLAVTQMPC